VPTGAESEDEAATADLVDRFRHFRDQTGIAESGAGNQRPDLQVRNTRCHGRNDREGFPDPADLTIVPGKREMIGEPERIESRFGCGLANLEYILESWRWAKVPGLGDRDHDPDTHRPLAFHPVRSRNM
jgi:hypothetical protein